MDLKQTLIDIFSKEADIKITEADFDKNVDDDLGIDSLSRIRIVVAIEQKLGIEISEANVTGIKTIHQLYNHLQNQLAYENNK